MEGIVEVTICAGSNSGDRAANVRGAIGWLTRLLDSAVLSDVYETPEIHGIGPSYFNAVAVGTTSMCHNELDRVLKEYELRSGRDAAARKRGEVPIDLDIVIYDGEVVRPKDYSQNFFLIGYGQICSKAVADN